VLICGVKISHDAGIAAIDGEKLLFSTELEKLNNNSRYSSLDKVEQIAEILKTENIGISDVDRFVIDGWWSEPGASSTFVHSTIRDRPVNIQVAPYIDEGTARPCTARYSFANLDLGLGEAHYSSYHHATGHLFGCYCSSPFARRGEDALILVWDGGMTPRLYEVNATKRSAHLVQPLTLIMGNTFADFARYFEPFCADSSGWDDDRDLRYHLSIAGKAMAYAALGTVQQDLFGYFDDFLDGLTNISAENAALLARQVIADRNGRFKGLSNADIITTLQAYLGNSLLEALKTIVARRYGSEARNLGIAGGCALNIKWNSLLRESGLFREVWVPPFPNDSGAAIGAAAAEMFIFGRLPAIDWNVYSGPRLMSTTAGNQWVVRPCTERQVAEILYREGEPVVVLSDRAELGPRALGNRSILAPTAEAKMKSHLNDIKGREGYRPIAPICIESRASEIFDPGTPDPYMLFEHKVRPLWTRAIPAVVHLDGTARLQTIRTDTSVTGRILDEYARLSGIPVLCNTSANFSGKGFFPDIASASRWGETKYIWSDGKLFVKKT
jgi:carbamoyltransferase